MSAAERQALMARYNAGYAMVAEAVAGVSDADLDHQADGWTARQIVHHLADSEMTSAIRLRRLLAEENPHILGYDEELYTRMLPGDRPIDASLAAIDAARRTSAELLDRLTDADWQRAGTHSESGPYSVETWLTIYAAHAHDHAEQIRRAIAG